MTLNMYSKAMKVLPKNRISSTEASTVINVYQDERARQSKVQSLRRSFSLLPAWRLAGAPLDNLKFGVFRFELTPVWVDNVLRKVVFDVVIQLWEYDSPTWAGKFLDEWSSQTMRSRVEPMMKIAKLPLDLSHSRRCRLVVSFRSPANFSKVSRTRAYSPFLIRSSAMRETACCFASSALTVTSVIL